MSLDVFKADGFSLRSLTSAINTRPFVPSRIGQMGLFEQQGITTTTAQLEQKDGVLYLIEAKPRGAPGKQNQDEGRKLIPLNCVHLPVEDSLEADEIQNIREFGSETNPQTIQGKVNEKLDTINQSFEATLEYHRLGALRGVVLDADGLTTLYNLYTVFGVSKLDAVNFDLTNENAANGAVRTACSAVIRQIEDELGAIPYTGIQGFCGSQFMDDLVAHPETQKAWERWQDGEALRGRTARRTFFYGGIMFEEYRGKVGSVDYIAAGECEFFPVGSPGLFKCVYAPANWVETVNTVGLPRYARQVVRQNGSGVDLYAQSNPLHYCTRPRTLIKGIGRSG
jgi:hypothetical protein